MKDGALIDRVVLITGSSRGIGAEVAVKGAEGTVERARSVGAEAESFQADVGDGLAAEGLVARVIDRFGRLDGLVNNAGRTQVGPFLEIDPSEWEDVIRTDLTATFHTCRAALPSMIEPARVMSPAEVSPVKLLIAERLDAVARAPLDDTEAARDADPDDATDDLD